MSSKKVNIEIKEVNSSNEEIRAYVKVYNLKKMGRVHEKQI